MDIQSMLQNISRISTYYQNNEIKRIFHNNNENIKNSSKIRLQKKFQWIKDKYTLPYHQNKPKAEHPPSTHQKDKPLDTPNEKVTLINMEKTDISEDAIGLLALGPNFALTPQIDKKFKEDINVKFTETAVKLRWKELFSERPTVQSSSDHLMSKAPFQKPFTAAPPRASLLTERSLCILQNDRQKSSRTTR